jgi:hypothetical protein
VPAQRLHQEGQHVDLLLGVARLDGEDEAAGVVEERVDPERPGLAADLERRPVADIALPERTRLGGLPAKPGVLPHAAAHRDPVKPVRLEEAAHGGLGNGLPGQPAVLDERAQDERDGGGRVLPSDVEQELALLG